MEGTPACAGATKRRTGRAVAAGWVSGSAALSQQSQPRQYPALAVAVILASNGIFTTQEGSAHTATDTVVVRSGCWADQLAAR